MPKINVVEKDMSWYYRAKDPGALTVLMPIVSAWGPYEPTLVDASTFTSVYGAQPADPADLSYPMAASLATNGLSVLGIRINLAGTVASYTPGSGSTEIPIAITAKYSGTYGNSLRVRTTNYTPVKRTEAEVEVTDSDDDSGWNTSKNYVFEGTGSGLTHTPGHLYIYNSDDTTWEDEGAYITSVSFVLEVYNRFSNTLLERVSYEIVNQASTYYYDTVNRSTQYAEIQPAYTTTYAPASLATATPINAILTGGENATDSGVPVDYSYESVLTHLENELIDIETLLSDPLVYDFDIIIDGGYNHHTSEGIPSTDLTTVDQYWTRIAVSRGTAIYLVDGNKSYTDSQFLDYCGNEVFNSYCAAYGPWSYAILGSNGSTRLLPGSYVMLVAWAKAIEGGAPMYLAPAGVSRAALGNLVKSTAYPVGSAIINEWQNNSNKNYSINPIAKLKQFGYVVYGNRTLLKDNPLGGTSMLQAFSTRVLVNLIKRRSFDIALTLQFDQASGDLFAKFQTELSTFMEELRYNNALYDYQILLDESMTEYDALNQKTLPVKIRISPSPAIENFEISLEIYPSGVSFNEDMVETSTSESV